MRHWVIAIGIMIVTGAFLPVYGAERTAPQIPGKIIPQPDANAQVLRAILWQQDDRIDLAKAEITLDHLIDPSVDQAAEL